MRVHPDFVAATAFDLVALDHAASTAYGLTEDLRLVYVNDAWRRFASANGAPPEWVDVKLGGGIMAATPPQLRPFYEEMFRRARATRAHQDHDYECSSPDTYRRFRMRVYPAAGSGFLVVHDPLWSGPHPGPASPAVDARYERDGIIVMCMHCRRTRRADADAWDWVPDYVACMPANVSHGLCPPCADFYYPASR
jgi:hypothetical protein